MKLSPAESESIIALLTRIYSDILDIEEQYHLIAGGDDFRPRIEHFHDAVRAFSSGHPQERLSVELLAYDLQALRYIVSMPLASFKAEAEAASPSTSMVAKDKSLAVRRQRPDRAVRERLSELYQSYAVLFAALLKPNADRDYHERVDNLNQDVENLHTLSGAMENFAANKKQTAQVMDAIHNLDEDELRTELLSFMHKQHYGKKDNLSKLMQFLKEHAARKDKEIASVEEAHMNYAMAQLGIFENSKDLLKKMASQGMNIVGRFVQNAIADAKREMGR